MTRGPAARAYGLQQVLLDVEGGCQVSSFCPGNFESEVERVGAALATGKWEVPRFSPMQNGSFGQRYERHRATLSAVEVALKDAQFQSELGARLTELLAERVAELALELEAARHVGTNQVASLGRQRFRFSSSELDRAKKAADAWGRLELDAEPESKVSSLAAQISRLRDADEPMARQIAVVERPIASKCAVGNETLFVRLGATGSRQEARRLWVHEGRGHLLPRLAAKSESVPYAIGTPGCSVDEEGRALLLEQRAGYLDVARKREIARRFLLAQGSREAGTDGLASATMDRIASGDDPRVVSRVVCRILRGGGWAREVVYLPGYLRVSDALSSDPGAEVFFERGRASVQALDYFRSLPPPSSEARRWATTQRG